MRKIMILAVTLIAAGSMGTISAQAFNKTNGVGFALTDDDGCVIWDDPNTMTAPAVEVASTTTTGRLTLKPVPATVTSVVETTTIAIVNAPETAPTFAGVTTEDSTTETTTETTTSTTETTTVSTETTTETTTSDTTSAETSAETSTETTVTTTAETVMVKASDGETEITVVTTWDKIKTFVKSLFS